MKAAVSDLLKNVVVVYIGKFVGSLLLAFMVFDGFYAFRGPGSMGTLMLTIADTKVNLSFIEALWRGIFCNWLVWSWPGFIQNNLIPVTIGNIIGGAFFVGVLYLNAYLKGRKAMSLVNNYVSNLN